MDSNNSPGGAAPQSVIGDALDALQEAGRLTPSDVRAAKASMAGKPHVLKFAGAMHPSAAVRMVAAPTCHLGTVACDDAAGCLRAMQCARLIAARQQLAGSLKRRAKANVFPLRSERK